MKDNFLYKGIARRKNLQDFEKSVIYKLNNPIFSPSSKIEPILSIGQVSIYKTESNNRSYYLKINSDRQNLRFQKEADFLSANIKGSIVPILIKHETAPIEYIIIETPKCKLYIDYNFDYVAKSEDEFKRFNKFDDKQKAEAIKKHKELQAKRNEVKCKMCSRYLAILHDTLVDNNCDNKYVDVIKHENPFKEDFKKIGELFQLCKIELSKAYSQLDDLRIVSSLNFAPDKTLFDGLHYMPIDWSYRCKVHPSVEIGSVCLFYGFNIDRFIEDYNKESRIYDEKNKKICLKLGALHNFFYSIKIYASSLNKELYFYSDDYIKKMLRRDLNNLLKHAIENEPLINRVKILFKL